MRKNFDVQQYWLAVLNQDADAIAAWFHSDAWVNWNNTNEHFSVEEFIKANCTYPGDWDGEVEKAVYTHDQVITALHVYPKDRSQSFHVTSFIRLLDGKIASIDEYWGDDGEPPKWRRDLKIGTKIKDTAL